MRIVSFSIVGPGEGDRWLEPFLKHLVPLVDEIAVCLNNPDPKTEAIVRRYTTHIAYDNREWGKFQNVIKRDFLDFVAKRNPDWILTMDCDEFMDKRITRAKLEELAASPTDIAYQFWCIQLWNDEEHYREDLCFENTRFYKYAPEYDLSFERQPLHCGLAPLYAYKYATHTNFIFRHYGLMLPEDRKRKVARYAKYDPKEKYIGKSWYNALRNERAEIKPFVEEDIYPLLPELQHKKKLPTMIKKPQVYWLFRNKHGRIVEAVNDKQRDQFVKTGYTFIQEVNPMGRGEAAVVPSAPSVEAPVVHSEPIPPSEAEKEAVAETAKTEEVQTSPITAPKLKSRAKAKPSKATSDLV